MKAALSTAKAQLPEASKLKKCFAPVSFKDYQLGP
jgi:hypothetical protein